MSVKIWIAEIFLITLVVGIKKILAGNEVFSKGKKISRYCKPLQIKEILESPRSLEANHSSECTKIGRFSAAAAAIFTAPQKISRFF